VPDPAVDGCGLEDVDGVRRATVLEDVDGSGSGSVEVFGVNPKSDA
jgi:hypothetical protein